MKVIFAILLCIILAACVSEKGSAPAGGTAAEAPGVAPSAAPGETTPEATAELSSQAGPLDFAFGSGGEVNFTIWSIDKDDVGRTVIEDTQKRLLVGGAVYKSQNPPVVSSTWRLDEDGKFDQSFGSNGTGKNPSNCQPHLGASALALDGGGNILVAGTCWMGAPLNASGVVWRMKPDGSMDSGFGNNGVALSNNNNDEQSAAGIAIDPNKKILLLGSMIDPGWNNTVHIQVWRFNENGALDKGFNAGSGFQRSLVFQVNEGGKAYWSDEEAFAVVLDNGGRIFMTGYVCNNAPSSKSGCDMLLMTLAPDGLYEKNFGGPNKFLQCTTSWISAERAVTIPAWGSS